MVVLGSILKNEILIKKKLELLSFITIQFLEYFTVLITKKM